MDLILTYVSEDSSSYESDYDSESDFENDSAASVIQKENRAPRKFKRNRGLSYVTAKG